MVLTTDLVTGIGLIKTELTIANVFPDYTSVLALPEGIQIVNGLFTSVDVSTAGMKIEKDYENYMINVSNVKYDNVMEWSISYSQPLTGD